MIEYERKFTVDPARVAGVSLHSLGRISRVLEITDYYPQAEGPGTGAPVARLRQTREAGRETLEMTVKTNTDDPNARNEWNYPIPNGAFRTSDLCPQARKVRYQFATLRSHIAGGYVEIPDRVVCTLDVFSWPADLPPVLEIEGPKGAVDRLWANLGLLEWLTPVDTVTRRYAPRV